MKIAIVGELRSPIKKNTYSGTEIWTYYLAEKLAEEKHDVVLFANSESSFRGKIVQVCHGSDIVVDSDSETLSRSRFFLGKEIFQVIEMQNKFDIIHFSVFGFNNLIFYLKLIKKPVVLTIHGYTGSKEFARLLFDYSEQINYVFISNFMFRSMPSPKKYKIIQNGIDVDSFPFSDKNKGYYFWINRISEEKGLEHSIEFSKKTGARLFIAGLVQSKNYYNKILKSNLNSRIKFIGGIDFKTKVQYYRQAIALLQTTNWDEPFGLNVIESMACGTPVIAFNRGAMSEIIKDKVTGYIVNPKEGVDGIINASKKLLSLSPDKYQQMRINCRKHVEENFTLDRMLSEYEDYYKEILKKSSK